MSDRQKSDDIENANLGKSSGHITHSDGTSTSVGSEYGPNARKATHSDGSTSTRDMFGRWHRDPQSVKAPEFKAIENSYTGGGTGSAPTFSTGSRGGGGLGEGGGLGILGAVGMVLGVLFYIFNRGMEAFQTSPVLAGAYVIAWIAFIAIVVRSSRKIPWLIMSVAAILLWPLGAWMMPRWMGMFCPGLVILGILAIIGKILASIVPYGGIIFAAVLAIAFVAIVVASWNEINLLGVIGISVAAATLVAAPFIPGFGPGSRADFSDAMRAGFLPLLAMIGVFYALRHKMEN